MRRCPLWPETIEAIREAIIVRKEPADKADSDILFITSHGKRWNWVTRKGTAADNVGKEFSKLLKRLGLKRERVGYYAIRHGFETAGGCQNVYSNHQVESKQRLDTQQRNGWLEGCRWYSQRKI